jgi:hypothetical protein
MAFIHGFACVAAKGIGNVWVHLICTTAEANR